MIRAHLLAVLAAIATSGADARTARSQAMRRVPIGLRAVVRTRVDRALSEVRMQAGGDERHVHRLAYVQAIGREVAPEDRAAVQMAFDSIRAEHPELERSSRAQAALVGLLLFVVPGAILTWWIWLRLR